jgi:hypothetical protein
LAESLEPIGKRAGVRTYFSSEECAPTRRCFIFGPRYFADRFAIGSSPTPLAGGVPARIIHNKAHMEVVK